MQWHGTAATALVAAIAALASDASQAQVRRFVTPPDQVIAIRAGHLFDSEDRQHAGEPGGADPRRTHRRRRPVGRDPARSDDHRPQPGDRDARHDRRPCSREHRRREPRACGRSPRSPTPRPTSRRASPPCSTWIRAAASIPSSCATPSTTASSRARACRWSASRSIRAPPATTTTSSRRASTNGFVENKNINGPWLARAAVREAKLHGVDFVKIYTTQDFAGTDAHVEAGCDARQQPVAHLRGGRGDRRRGAPARRQGRLPRLWRRRHGQLHQGGRRCAQSPAQARRQGRQDPARQEAALRADRRRPDRARRARPEGDRRPQLAAQAPRAGVPEGGRRRHSDRVRLAAPPRPRSRTASRRTSSPIMRSGA